MSLLGGAQAGLGVGESSPQRDARAILRTLERPPDGVGPGAKKPPTGPRSRPADPPSPVNRMPSPVSAFTTAGRPASRAAMDPSSTAFSDR